MSARIPLAPRLSALPLAVLSDALRDHPDCMWNKANWRDRGGGSRRADDLRLPTGDPRISATEVSIA
jgi:hypothetical protein